MLDDFGPQKNVIFERAALAAFYFYLRAWVSCAC